MQRISLEERPDWRAQADLLGYSFLNQDAIPSWDESKAYVLTAEQVDFDLKSVTNELHQMCIEAVDVAVQNERILDRLAIPAPYWDWIANSWRAREPSLYGRFDLFYDGTGPAKMLEYNADTPTCLYEAGFFQLHWFEEQRARGVISDEADQFNVIQDKLIARFRELFEQGANVHFSCCRDAQDDRGTVEYIEDCAIQAGLVNHFVFIDDIGVDTEGRFADQNDHVIDYLFKLYPLEHMFREDFGKFLPNSGVEMLEPPWKAILSNKGLLPLLWQMYPGHPNLLPSFFETEVDADTIIGSYVKKPLFSREGENVEVHQKGTETFRMPGGYGEEGFVIQAFSPTPKYVDDYAVVGSWIVGDEAVGIGIREDTNIVTQDISRFVPHVVVN